MINNTGDGNNKKCEDKRRQKADIMLSYRNV